MGAGVQKQPECLVCGAPLNIPEGAVKVRCIYCHEVMEVTRFTQEERRLAAAVDELSQRVKSAEQCMQKAIDSAQRKSSAAAKALYDQSKSQYESLKNSLTQLRNEYENGQARKLEGWFRLGEEAQRARRYDDAIKYYDYVIAERNDEAEVHWRRLLCRYGVEYIYDQSSGLCLPTLTKMCVDNLLKDDDYEQACRYARSDDVRAFYESEGRRLSAILQSYQDISGSENAYDVFISVKQGDKQGRMTSDAEIALDLYHTLKNLGLRVFNSRKSLEDKAGTEYEPYIMHALMTAKMMVVVASSEEHINSRWLKNEWRRFRWLREREGLQSKRRLIVYSTKLDGKLQLPAELGAIQAIDSKKDAKPVERLCSIAREIFKEKGIGDSADDGDPLAKFPILKRMFIHLEYGEFDSALEVYGQAANVVPENGYLYLGRLMIELKVRKAEELVDQDVPFDRSNNYLKLMQFGSEALKKQVRGYISVINERKEYNRKMAICEKLIQRIRQAESIEKCNEVKRELQLTENFEGAAAVQAAYDERVEEIGAQVYAQAEELRKQGQWQQALDVYETIPSYKLSGQGADCCREKIYEYGVKLMALQRWQQAAESFRHSEGFADSGDMRKSCLAAVQKMKRVYSSKLSGDYKLGAMHVCAGKISTTAHHTVGVKADGTVVAVGKKPFEMYKVLSVAMMIPGVLVFVPGVQALGAALIWMGVKAYSAAWKDIHWTDVEQVGTGWAYTIGLKRDGTVEGIGGGMFVKRNVSDWKDIVQVTAGKDCTFGLKSDGTVIAVSNNESDLPDMSGWRNIIAISAGEEQIVGLRSDGTVMAKHLNDGKDRQLAGWSDIVAVSVGSEHIVGVKADGSVIAEGSNKKGQCDVGSWSDIVTVAAGSSHTVGLKEDGTVVAAGSDDNGQCNVRVWRNIVAVAAGGSHTVGLKADGTLTAVGTTSQGQCDVSGWKLWK